MTRLVRQYFLPGVDPARAGAVLAPWLASGGFRILTPASDGVTRRYAAPEVRQQMNPGQAVLDIPSRQGDAIGLHTSYGPNAVGWPFVALLRVEPQSRGGAAGTLVTGEFFFAVPEGVNSLGVREWTPSPSMWGVGGVVRRKAWPIIELFDREFSKGLPQPPPGFVAPPTPWTPGPAPAGQVLGSTAAGAPPPPAALDAQVQRTSRMQSANIVVQVATQLHFYMSILFLLILIPVSILVVVVMVGSGFHPALLDLVTLGIVAATFVLTYSVYVALVKVQRPIRRGETQGVAQRALFLGIGGVAIGLILGAALSWFAAIYCVAGVLYLVVYAQLRRDSPTATPTPA